MRNAPCWIKCSWWWWRLSWVWVDRSVKTVVRTVIWTGTIGMLSFPMTGADTLAPRCTLHPLYIRAWYGVQRHCAVVFDWHPKLQDLPPLLHFLDQNALNQQQCIATPVKAPATNSKRWVMLLTFKFYLNVYNIYDIIFECLQYYNILFECLQYLRY